MSEPAPASADGGGGGGGGKGEASGDSVGSLPCTPMHASAGGCRPVQHGQGPKSCLTPFFFLGGSAQLSFRARVRRIGASDGELGRGSRHRPSLSCQSANPGTHHGSQMHRCKEASEPPTDPTWPGRARERGRGRGKSQRRISRPASLVARARAHPTFTEPQRANASPKLAGRSASLAASKAPGHTSHMSEVGRAQALNPTIEDANQPASTAKETACYWCSDARADSPLISHARRDPTSDAHPLHTDACHRPAREKRSKKNCSVLGSNQ